MTMRKLLFLFILTILPVAASAIDIDGINYILNQENNTAKVVAKNKGVYTGDISIPSYVVYEGIQYDVTSIDERGFERCSNLKSISIPISVNSIGAYAFFGCSKLTSIAIPDGVTTIEQGIFEGCTNLAYIDIPNSVTFIGGNAFTRTLWFDNQPDGIVYAGKVVYTYKGIMPENTSIIIDEGTLGIIEGAFYECSGLTSISLPNSLTRIGAGAFSGCSGLSHIDIPNGVTSIEKRTFYGCSNLATVTIPESVTSIGEYAFWGCFGINSLVIPNSVTSIGEYAFGKCSSMTTLAFGNGVTSIGGNAFSECYSLKSVHISDIAAWVQIDFANVGSNPLSRAYHLYMNGEEIEDLVIPTNVTSIGRLAFYECASLKSVTIPNSVISIGEDAFNDCSGLTSVSISNSVTSIEEGAFSGCRGLTSVTIPKSVISIGKSAFSGCSGLTSVSIPNSVSFIDNYVFARCSGLTSVKIPNSVTSIEEGAFHGCSGLVSLAIPNSVISIGESAFSDCSGLTSVVIPNSVTFIGDGAFDQCIGLLSVSIPNSVSSIGHCAFRGCRSITSLYIGNGVTNIGIEAFEDCSHLTKVYCMPTEVPMTDLGAFNRVNIRFVTLHVPEGSIDKYAAVEPWKNFGNIEGVIDDADLFPDCPEGEIRDAAIYLYHKGIVEGEDGKLYAGREAIRAEVSKTSFYGAYFGPDNVPAELGVDNFPSVYTDLQDKNTYYYRPAKALLYLDYGDGVTPFDRNRLKFEPEGKIARVNVLKELLEVFNICPDLEGTNNPIPNDENVAALAATNPVKMGYIRKAAALGIITTDNNEFRPFANCTRGELFLMLARIMWKIEDGEIDNPTPQESDYFQPLNTTLKTIGLGASMQMGNFQHYTKTSFAMSGVVPLTFSHTYNSYNTTLPSVFFGAKTVNNVEETYQPMGDGWSHNYHSFITVVGEYSSGTPDNGLRAIVHWGGGGLDVYKYVDGQFVPESMGIYDDFTFENGEVLIKSKSQVEFRFSMQDGSGANVLYLYSIKDRNGNELSINYQDGQNGSKRISSVSDGQRELKFSYLDGTDLLSEVKDPLNRSVSFTYFDNIQTGKKQLESFTDAEGNTTTYEYADLTKSGTSKLLSRIQLPKGNYVENEYDANRRLSQTVSGLNGVPTTKTSITVTADYNNGTASTSSDVVVERGSQTSTYQYAFNENNVVTCMTGAKDLFVNSSYDDAEHPELATTIQNNNTNSSIAYDQKGNVTSITVTGDGSLTTTMTYDEMNNLTSVTDPNNNTTTYNYDEKGNLVGVSAPEGVTTSLTVDNKGLPTETQNPMGVITQYEYNKYGNVETVSLPALGLSSSAEYDDASRLESTKDALGRTHSFVYNNNDFLTSETDALEHTTKYAYDENDNLISITNAKNGVTTLSYDNATDWLLSVEFAGAKKQYDYNKDGTLSSYTKPDGTTLSNSYDELGRITSDGVNSYSYDDKLRLSEISDGSKIISFSYDRFNRITGTAYDGHSNNYGYDKNGNCTSVNGTTYEYDGLNRLISVTFNDKTISYSYRKDSQLDKVEYPNGMTTTFGYDEVGRLTSKQTTLSSGTMVAGYSYVLDKVGNIMEQTTQEPYAEVALTNEDVNYTYNDDNRITKAGDISFEFDKNGNTTKRGSEGLAWDVQDRLTAAGSTAITYDPLGLIASFGDITFTTDPLGIGNVLSDSKSGAEYIYGNGLEARVIDGKVSYYVTDVRGSVIAIVDEDGNITHKYQYDEFGKVTQKEEADYNPFQYVGKYGVISLNDHLYYMRARHYDPTIGRFLSEDPIWSTNLYPYADNNPIMGIDPRGLKTMSQLQAERKSIEENYNIELSRAWKDLYYGIISMSDYDLRVSNINSTYESDINEILKQEEALVYSVNNNGKNKSSNKVRVVPEDNTPTPKKYQWPLEASPNVYPDITTSSKKSEEKYGWEYHNVDPSVDRNDPKWASVANYNNHIEPTARALKQAIKYQLGL